MSEEQWPARGSIDDRLITALEFASLARLSRRQIDRLRKRRAPCFQREYELGSSSCKYPRCPRFRLLEVQRWLGTRALWWADARA